MLHCCFRMTFVRQLINGLLTYLRPTYVAEKKQGHPRQGADERLGDPPQEAIRSHLLVKARKTSGRPRFVHEDEDGFISYSSHRLD